jgi:hypothetical protein
MPEQFLHGVEVVEIESGPRPISTVRSAIIGLIGTAPEAETAAFATLLTGSTDASNAILWTAKYAGAAGNKVSVHALVPNVALSPLAITVSENAITISLETGATPGVSITTQTGLVTAINADVRASALVEAEADDGMEIILPSAAVTGGALGDGEAEELITDGDVTTLAITPPTYEGGVVLPWTKALFLAGGRDAALPLNQPVLVTKRSEAARFGLRGTIPLALDAIWDQGDAWVVVVRVASGVDAAATRSNIIGNSAGARGVWAFTRAEARVHAAPRLLIAPWFSNNLAVAQEMVSVADRLRGIAIIDGPNTTYVAAATYRENFGSARAYLVDPAVRYWSTRNNAEAKQPASPRVAGVIARSDNERGFWWSPSNREIQGITGATRNVDFELGDPYSQANYLNENEVATIVRKDGYRLWGNRTCSADPKWAFLSVRRTADMIQESLLRAHLWAVDRNITRTYMEDVVDGVNAYLAHLVAVGAILGGTCWADAELNTPDQIAQGKVYFDFDFTPPYPAEHITFRSHLVDDYLVEVLPQATA